MAVAMPFKPSAKAAKTPAVSFLLIALAVPIPCEARPNPKPLADISFNFKKSKAKVPKEAPIIPVKIVIMAVSDGIPPIKSAIPIAIGAVALRGSILNKT